MIILALSATFVAVILPQEEGIQATDSVGPFLITSSISKVNTFPYPTTVKMTKLSWRSRDGLVSYQLWDDGDQMQVEYAVGAEPRRCLGKWGPLTMTPPPKGLFASETFLMPCAEALSSAQLIVLTKEVGRDRRSFRTAYQAFLAQTRELHGGISRRCKRYEAGNHGLFCVKYSNYK